MVVRMRGEDGGVWRMAVVCMGNNHVEDGGVPRRRIVVVCVGNHRKHAFMLQVSITNLLSLIRLLFERKCIRINLVTNIH